MYSLESTPRGLTRPLSVAPMMDRTDRHCRYFLRLLSRRALLYTEMVTTQALLHGDPEWLLGFSPEEHPLSLQLGGDDPVALARCARMAESYGYDEVNLNVGCPSDRVQQGRFGACLMAEPGRVAEAVSAMRAVVRIPVTVKHRIGIDDHDRYEDLSQFVSQVAAAGCDRFSVHARAAWLKGLSPKENREIPPLRYEEVHRLKRDFPSLVIEINGGITSLAQAKEQLKLVDAVMIGRAAYDDPFLLSRVDEEIFGEDLSFGGRAVSRRQVIEALVPYAARHIESGRRLHDISRHLLGLFTNQPNGRLWRRFLSTEAVKQEAKATTLLEALEVMEKRPSV